jgi:hypothetical protein
MSPNTRTALNVFDGVLLVAFIFTLLAKLPTIVSVGIVCFAAGVVCAGVAIAVVESRG